MSKSVAVVSACLVLIVVAAALRGQPDEAPLREPDFAALTESTSQPELTGPATTGSNEPDGLQPPATGECPVTDTAEALNLELELALAADRGENPGPSISAGPSVHKEEPEQATVAESTVSAPELALESTFAPPPEAVMVRSDHPANRAPISGFIRNPYLDYAVPVKADSPAIVERAEPALEIPQPSEVSEAESPRAENTDLLPPLASEADLPDSRSSTARSRLEQGHRLAARGATAAAREEFIAALAAAADSRDHRTGTTSYSQLLQRGLLHLDELRDFFPGTESSPTASTSSIVDTHGSDLISVSRAAGLSRPAATSIYQRAVAERFGEICRLDPVAPEALACIAKLHAIRHASGGESGEYDFCVAVLLNEIALRCEPANPRYANELGVLYAMQGNLDASRDMFVQSLRQMQTVEVWTNLAQLHQRRKEAKLAELAASEARRLAVHLAVSGDSGRVRWISPADFGGQPEPDHGHQSVSVLERGEHSASQSSAEPGTGFHRLP
jgi:hypothetical protein